MRRVRILHKAGFLGIFACLGLLPCGSAVHAATSAPAKQAASPVPVIVVQPAIVANSNPAVPLAAVVTLQARNAIAVDVSVQERLAGRPDRSWRVLAPVASDGSVSLPIVGFRHSSDLTVTIALRSARGTSTPLSNKLTYHAPPVPDVGLSWPKIETVEIDRGRVEPGITFVSVRRNFLERGSLMTPRQRDFQRKFGLIIALNEDGEVVWYYRSLQRIAGIQSMPDGRILMTLADQRTRIIDVLGNVKREYVAGQSPDRDPSSGAIPIDGIQTIHHEPYLTKQGTFIAMSANARRIDNYYTSVTDPNALRKAARTTSSTLAPSAAKAAAARTRASASSLSPGVAHPGSACGTNVADLGGGATAPSTATVPPVGAAAAAEARLAAVLVPAAARAAPVSTRMPGLAGVAASRRRASTCTMAAASVCGVVCAPTAAALRSAAV